MTVLKTKMFKKIKKFFKKNKIRIVCFVTAILFSFGSLFTEKSLPYVSITFWFLSILLLILTFIQFKKPKINLKEVYIILLIFLVAFLIRSVAIDILPFWMHGDEGYFSFQSANILNGVNNDVYGLNWWFYENLWPVIQAPFLAIFGTSSLLGARLPSALIGSLGIVVIFLLVKKLFNTKAALIASIFLMINPLNIHFSRIAVDNIITPLLELLVLLFAYLGLKKKFYFIFMGLIFGLSFHFYPGNKIMIGMIPVGALILLFFKKIKIKDILVSIGLFATGFFFGFAPYIFEYISAPSRFAARAHVFSVDIIQLLMFKPEQIKLFTQHLTSSFICLYNNTCYDSFFSGNYYDIVTLGIICISPILLFIKRYRVVYIFSALLLAAIFIVGAGLTGGEIFGRLIALSVFSSIIIAMLGDLVINITKKQKILKKLVPATMAVMMLGIGVYNINKIYGIENNLGIGRRLLAETVKQEPQRIYYYLTENPGYYADHGIQRFIAPNVSKKSIKDISEIPNMSNNIALVVYPNDTAKIRTINEKYIYYKKDVNNNQGEPEFEIFYINGNRLSLSNK
jgi:hypothetical protein